MRKLTKVKTGKRVAASILAAAFVFMSATTAFASDLSVADLENKVYEMADQEMAMPYDRAVVADDGMVEYYCSVDDLNVGDTKEVIGTDDVVVSRTAGVFYSFEWVVNPNTRHISGEHSINAGLSLSVGAVVSPGDKDYWLGIMTDDGIARYVRGQGAASHTFDIREKNRYRVFVQNNYKDSTKLNAYGDFIYR
ncbi:MAG: hypothetical protein HFH35_15345 [Eubacterium sp.]|nr:hypothetical protein [Eubacterium sp.]